MNNETDAIAILAQLTDIGKNQTIALHRFFPKHSFAAQQELEKRTALLLDSLMDPDGLEEAVESTVQFRTQLIQAKRKKIRKEQKVSPYMRDALKNLYLSINDQKNNYDAKHDLMELIDRSHKGACNDWRAMLGKLDYVLEQYLERQGAFTIQDHDLVKLLGNAQTNERDSDR